MLKLSGVGLKSFLLPNRVCANFYCWKLVARVKTLVFSFLGFFTRIHSSLGFYVLVTWVDEKKKSSIYVISISASSRVLLSSEYGYFILSHYADTEDARITSIST